MKKPVICPHCKNPINDEEALLCLYCGESLNRRGRFHPLLFAAILCVLIVSFLLSLLLH